MTGLSGELQTIPLENATFSRADEAKKLTIIFRKTLDMGDVLVSSPNSKYLCKKINGVQEFLKALQGLHLNVQPLLAPKPFWYETNVVDKEFIFNYPAIPGSIYKGLLGAPSLQWLVEEKDFVCENQIIAEYIIENKKAYHVDYGANHIYKATIIAPANGQIEKINDIEYAEWNKSEQSQLKTNTLFSMFLEKSKSSRIEAPSSRYVYDHLVDYCFGINADRNFIKSQVDLLCSSRPSKEKIDNPIPNNELGL